MYYLMPIPLPMPNPKFSPSLFAQAPPSLPPPMHRNTEQKVTLMKILGENYVDRRPTTDSRLTTLESTSDSLNRLGAGAGAGAGELLRGIRGGGGREWFLETQARRDFG
jgi:hypothetical protein